MLNGEYELGYRSGMNHLVCQYDLDSLTNGQMEHLLVPAYESFSNFFGSPEAFCSPGFLRNRHVLELLDRFDLLYAADMDSEAPSCPSVGNRQDLHFQITSNINGYVPILAVILRVVKECVWRRLQSTTRSASPSAAIYMTDSIPALFLHERVKS